MRYFFFVVALFFTACGYKPISKISSEILGDEICVNVQVNNQEPKNSVFIKDAVLEGLVSRLGKKISAGTGDECINVVTKSLKYAPTIYDSYGYISSYKAVLSLSFFSKFKNGKTERFDVGGEYEFSVARRSSDARYADSIISDTEKYEAIKEASKEAFDEYISKLAIRGLKNGSN